MTLEYDPSLAKQPWPFTSVTPVEQHAHVALAVTGGSERGAGSFPNVIFFDLARRKTGLADRKYMPLRGAGLRVVVR